ncbi:MAG: DUF4159 domain-containing protein [Phycisphaerae bacterium]|nr:DUF4159 domain-containing protein [Phycisphaerae bacterium]
MAHRKQMFWVRVVIALSAAAGFSAPLRAQSTAPATKPTCRTLSRRQLDRAVVKGLRSLAKHTSDEGKLLGRSYRYQQGAGEALVVLAALEAGGDSDAPGTRALLDSLTESSPAWTTARALRAMIYARLGDRYRLALEEDVQWLIDHLRGDGGWGETPDAPADLFNGALAMLALQQADRLGVDISPTVWDRAKQFLLAAQNPDGGYGYQYIPGSSSSLRGYSHGSATAAGAVMWGVLIDRKQLPPPNHAKNPLWEAFGRVARWLEGHFDLQTVPQWYWGDAPEYAYRYLLLLAEPSLKTSRPEWSSLPGQLAALLLDRQSAEGHWEGQALAENDAIATAWAVLTLCRARQELLAAQPAPTRMAPEFRPRKLLILGRIHHAGDWDIFENTEDQWSDALAGALSVGLKRQDVFAGQDYNPAVALVHLTGTRLAGFGAPARAALKEYLQRGGMVLIDPARGGEEFFTQAKTMLEAMFGSQSLAPLAPDDPLITGRFAGDVGSDLTRVKFTPAAAKSAGRQEGPPVLWAVKEQGRLVAILSRYSLTPFPKNEFPNPPASYAPDDANRVALNVLLYTYAARQQALK